MKPKKVLLITNTYPAKDSPEKPFILPELRALLAAGHMVVLLPVCVVSFIDPDLPEGVSVGRRLADSFRTGSRIVTCLYVLSRVFFWEEIWAARRYILKKGKHFRHFVKESLRAGAILRLGKWLAGFDVIYTYWFSGEASGLVLNPHAKGKRITRAHGYDLYLERECNRGYIPFRDKVIEEFDKIVVLGEEAKRYILDRYIVSPVNLYLSPLGVPSKEATNPFPDQSSIRLVTCSYPKAVKRFPLMARLISTLAERCHDKPVHWTHFGCSFDEANFGDDFLPSRNMYFDFRGRVANQEVNEHYKHHPVHFFLNLSESEGMPVSIMEAMSYGIPVVATAVGGIPEMIDSECGVLIEKDPDINSVALLLEKLLKDEVRYRAMRAASQQRQRENFDSKINHEKFAKWIGSL